MPLNWNAEKVPAEVREENWQLLEKAVWYAMAIGVPVLTDATLAKAVERTRQLEEQRGAYLYSGDDAVTPLYLWERLHLFVGLKTNASKLTDAQFRRGLAI
ncbi:MAG: hypothetical protein ACO3RU_13025 [Planctomycetota bacterium]